MEWVGVPGHYDGLDTNLGTQAVQARDRQAGAEWGRSPALKPSVPGAVTSHSVTPAQYSELTIRNSPWGYSFPLLITSLAIVFSVVVQG